MAADVSAIFNSLTGYSTQHEFHRLVVAPRNLRTTLKRLVDREAAHARAGRRAHIVIKVNAVTDDAMIRALYRASQAGVTIDLLVRGICSLRPGVPGISERIRVRSIVGRFLEHSRVYWFANGGAEEMFIGSADVMERNLGRRVETLIPVRGERLLRHVRDVVLDAYLKDTDRAMVLDATGAYSRVPAGADARFNAQEFLLRYYTRDRRALARPARGARGASDASPQPSRAAELMGPPAASERHDRAEPGKDHERRDEQQAITATNAAGPIGHASARPMRGRGRASVNSRPATTPAA